MEKKFQHKSTDVFYTIIGSGQPVVLLHGFAEDGSIWNEQAAFLQHHCQLIIPDLPGSGKSPILKQEQPKIEDFAEVVNAMLNNEKIAKSIVLGHSMGGYITLAFADLFPDKLLAFGLVHSSAFADSEEKQMTRKKGIKFIEQHGVYSFLKNSTPNLFSNNFKEEHPEIVKAIIEKESQFSQESLVQYYNAMIARPNRTTVLEKSSVPVLFIIGSEDTAAPLDDLLKQVHLPAISVIHIIKNVGHMSMLEKPAELNEHLLQFIKSSLL